jgi:hypothetical protein
LLVEQSDRKFSEKLKASYSNSKSKSDAKAKNLKLIRRRAWDCSTGSVKSRKLTRAQARRKHQQVIKINDVQNRLDKRRMIYGVVGSRSEVLASRYVVKLAGHFQGPATTAKRKGWGWEGKLIG